MTRTPPIGSDWHAEQARLRSERQAIAAQSEQTMYEAGRKRGMAGQIDPPPWMGHLHELVPHADPMRLQNIAAAHHYGQVEGFTETEPDRIEDEFTPRAQKIVTKAKRAQESLDNARVTLGARGMVALAGRSRYPITPTQRRVHIAQARFDSVQAEADALHQELRGRLGAVEAMKSSLEDSPWKPRR